MVKRNKNKAQNKAETNVKSSAKINIRKDFITGKRNNKKLVTVEKNNFLFVSRLDEATECSDILDYLKEFKDANYHVEKLKTKFSGYSSFKIGIPDSLINEIFVPEFWPEGSLVAKFKFPTNSLNLQETKTVKGS